MGALFRPYRLKVFFSNHYAYAKILHQTSPHDSGHYVASASSLERQMRLPFREAQRPTADKAACEAVGKLLAERAKELKLQVVHFDWKPVGQANKNQSRSPVRYHGKLKALIDGIREAGLPVH